MKFLCNGSVAPKGRIRIYGLIRIPGDQIVVATRPPDAVELKSTAEYVELINTHKDANAIYTIATLSKTAFHVGMATGSLSWLLAKARADVLIPHFGEKDTADEAAHTVKKEPRSK